MEKTPGSFLCALPGNGLQHQPASGHTPCRGLEPGSPTLAGSVLCGSLFLPAWAGNLNEMLAVGALGVHGPRKPLNNTYPM